MCPRSRLSNPRSSNSAIARAATSFTVPAAAAICDCVIDASAGIAGLNPRSAIACGRRTRATRPTIGSALCDDNFAESSR